MSDQGATTKKADWARFAKSGTTLVSEIMTENPISAEPTTTVREVMGVMYSDDIRHLPVIDAGQLIGIISDRDLRSFSEPDALSTLDKLGEIGARLEDPISSIMRGDVVYIEADSTIDSLIDLMLETKIGAIPVVEPGTETLVGIVSYIDILETARGEL